MGTVPTRTGNKIRRLFLPFKWAQPLALTPAAVPVCEAVAVVPDMCRGCRCDSRGRRSPPADPSHSSARTAAAMTNFGISLPFWTEKIDGFDDFEKLK